MQVSRLSMKRRRQVSAVAASRKLCTLNQMTKIAFPRTVGPGAREMSEGVRNEVED